MISSPPAFLRNPFAPLLVVCLFALAASAIQAVMAHRLATATVEAYAPKIETQAASLIVEALPNNEKGKQAAHLAQVLATNAESQYAALSRAVESQASALAYQTLGWAVASILALLAVIESRRKV